MSLIILDRDGVINNDSDVYIKSPDEWQAIPGSLKAISALNKAGFRVIVATNQSGIARGLFDLATLEAIHNKLARELAMEGGQLTEIFFCPHHPDEGCFCRKPQPGMLFQIRDKYAADFSTVFYVGDSLSDIKAAQNAGCKPLLVLTGKGRRTLSTLKNVSDIPYVDDLAAAAEFVLHAR